MAISSSTRKAGPFLGNDATTVFPFAFKVFTAADLRVVRTNTLGIESDLVLDADYTVTLNSDQDNDPGGSVTRATALPTGERLTITSDVDALQPLVLTNNGGFYPRVINDAFDKITIIAQQLIEQVGRSLKLPISSTVSPTLPDPVPNGILAWNSAASGFVNVAPEDLATVAAYANARVEVFTGDGTETEFELEFNPGTLANLDISVGGVTQTSGVDFTFVGAVVIFASAPPSGATIQIRYTNVLEAAPDFELGFAAVAAAQLAETNAETAETNAEAAQAQTLIYRDETEVFRDETAVYAGTTNISNYYASTAAGLAATASGAYFGVPGTDGVAIYLDNAGSAVLQNTMPSIGWHAKNQQVIKLEYVASGSTTNNPIFRPRFSWVVLSGGMYEVTFEVDEWPATNITGSEGITLQQYSGAAFITGGQFKMPDNTAIETGYLEAGKAVRFRRDTATTLFEVIAPSDPVTLPVSKATSVTGPQGFLPSPIRPVMMVKVGPYTWEIRVYKPVGHYENGLTDRCQTDYDFYFLFDMAAFQGDTYAPALNSHGCRRLDHEYRFAQHRMFDLISGIISDTGHVPSTYEAVAMSGDFADTGNTTNYQLSGIGHGHLESVSWTLYGTTNDASTSNVDVQSSDLKGAAIGTTFFGDKIVSTGVYYDESPTGERLCQRTMVHTFESATTHTCKVTNVFDPTVGGLDAPWGVREGGYAGMFPIRNATRLRPAKVNPATGAVTEYGAIVNINLQDGIQRNITTNASGGADSNWNAFEMWDHRQTIGGQVARARYVNNAGAGFTHWVGAIIDANRVAREAPMFHKGETWGTKGYDPWYATTTKQDLSAAVVTTSVAYLTVFGDLPS